MKITVPLFPNPPEILQLGHGHLEIQLISKISEKDLLMGGHNSIWSLRKTVSKKFWQIEKKIIDLYELKKAKNFF